MAWAMVPGVNPGVNPSNVNGKVTLASAIGSRLVFATSSEMTYAVGNALLLSQSVKANGKPPNSPLGNIFPVLLARKYGKVSTCSTLDFVCQELQAKLHFKTVKNCPAQRSVAGIFRISVPNSIVRRFKQVLDVNYRN
jgi:hypothetical protein